MHEKVKSKSLKKLTERRISKLRLMFNNCDIDVTGNPEYPSLIYDTDKLLFTYINNFNLNFLTESPRTGYNPETILSYRIKEDTKVGQEFNRYISNQYWKKVFVIRHKETNLFLTGYSLDKDTWVTGRILSPVFGLLKRKYYYDKEAADTIVSLYPDIPLEII